MYLWPRFLLQLCKLAYKIINPSTIALLAWKEILKDLQMVVTLMPRDVTTQWNSMLNLLKYALKHHKAINIVIQWHELGLWDLELTDEEWVIVKQLQGVLKVSKVLIDSAYGMIQTNVVRSSGTQHCTSCVQPPISQWSSLWWTTLTRSSQCICATRIFFPPYILVSSSLKKLSIITTHAQTSLKCITLPWVSTASISFSNHPLM